MNEQPHVCGHKDCRCTTAGFAAFCSPYCEDAAMEPNENSQRCGCGHAACSAQAGRTMNLIDTLSEGGAEDESTDSDADAATGGGDPTKRGGTRSA